MFKSVRYAAVGVGSITQECFLPAVAESGNSVVSALFTSDPARTGEIADHYGCGRVLSYSEYADAMQSDLFEAVYVATPNQLHAEYALKALQAGKHVIVEKPLALNVDEANALIAAASEAGVHLMTSYRMHTDKVTQSILKQAQDGTIGDLRYFSSDFSFQVDAGNHRLAAESWGGPLQDIGIYCINLARALFQAEPISCNALSTKIEYDPRFREIADSISVNLLFPLQRIAQFTVSFGAAPVDSYRFVGTEGQIHVEGGLRLDTDTTVVLQTADRSLCKVYPKRNQFTDMIRHFSDCVLTGKPVGPDGNEGLRDIIVLHTIEKALSEGKTLSVQTS